MGGGSGCGSGGIVVRTSGPIHGDACQGRQSRHAPQFQLADGSLRSRTRHNRLEDIVAQSVWSERAAILRRAGTAVQQTAARIRRYQLQLPERTGPVIAWIGALPRLVQ